MLGIIRSRNLLRDGRRTPRRTASAYQSNGRPARDQGAPSAGERPPGVEQEAQRRPVPHVLLDPADDYAFPRDRGELRYILRMRLALAFLLLSSLSLSASPQWPIHVTPDVPRTADGQVDLSAPPPRLPNGKPDFSGVWDSRVPPAGRLGAPMLPSIGDAPPLAQFFDLERTIKEGLPMTPWARELKKQRMAANSKDNPDANCLPLGFMQLHTHSQPRKIVQNAKTMVIMYEANYGLRQIHTDGRSLPSADVNPFWDGYSVGTWDGDTLVVQSAGFRDEGWLDVNGSPFTSGLQLTERYRRVNYGRVEIDITVTDPKAYTRPFTVRVNWRLLPGDELIEFVCNENQKFVPQ
jgi:hypothetical protein